MHSRPVWSAEHSQFCLPVLGLKLGQCRISIGDLASYAYKVVVLPFPDVTDLVLDLAFGLLTATAAVATPLG